MSLQQNGSQCLSGANCVLLIVAVPQGVGGRVGGPNSSLLFALACGVVAAGNLTPVGILPH